MMAPNQQSGEAAAQLAQTDRYLQQDPSNPQLLARALDLSVAIGDFDLAGRYLDAALAVHGGDPSFRFRQAELLSAQGRWEQAEPVYAALLRDYEDVNIAYGLARARARRGDHAGGIDVLWPLRAASGLPPAAAAQLVRSLHHAGRSDDALAFALEAEPRYAHDPAFCAAASLAAFDEGDADAAERLSRQALAGGAAPVEALVVDGSLALGQLDVARAMDTFQRALAVRPDEGRSLAGLGTAHLVRREFDQALALLEAAHRNMPTHIGTLHLLAWCKLFTGSLAGARQHFDAALELDRNFADTHGGLAVVHAMQGDRPGAEREIALAMRLDASGLAARYAQMILASDTADPERFARLAERILDERPVGRGHTMASLLRRYRGS